MDISSTEERRGRAWMWLYLPRKTSKEGSTAYGAGVVKMCIMEVDFVTVAQGSIACSRIRGRDMLKGVPTRIMPCPAPS